MKVLLAALGSRGDVQPQLLLGDELARRGHHVSVAAPPDFRASVASHGFDFTPVGEAMATFIQRNQHHTEQHPVAALPDQVAVLRGYLRQQVRDLMSAGLEPDIVVAGGLCFGAQLLAQKRGVPHVYCWYSLTAVMSAQHPPPFVPLFGLPRFVNRALWAGLGIGFQLAVGGSMNRMRRRHSLPPRYNPWGALHADHIMLAQDAIIGDLPDDAPGRNNTQVPALVPRRADAQPLSDWLERFLRGANDGRGSATPVVYLGFGSMPSVDRTRIVQIAVELFEQHGARVILQSPTNEDAATPLPAGVFAVGDVDHTSLFPRVDLIVHHGGAGTTASALRSGVPQLVVPHVLDQFFHGRRIADLGLGPEPVPKTRLDTHAIASALKTRSKYWAKAQAARASIEPDGGATQAANHIETLARSGAARG